MDTQELEVLDPPQLQPIVLDGVMIVPPFPVVHDQLLCLSHIEGEVVVLAPHCQVSDLHIGCLFIVGDQAYHCCIVRKLNDDVGVVLGHTVVGEQSTGGD